MIQVIFVLFMAVAVFAGFSGYSYAKEKSAYSELENISKTDYANKLEQLPQEIYDGWDKPVGAMCYDTAAPMDRLEYICPKCGEVTLYSFISEASSAVSNINYLRNLVKKITKMQVTLDESRLCTYCGPKATANELCIIVQANKNSKPKKTCGITESDINLLYEYSEGQKEHTDVFGFKAPIENYYERLEELLGVKISK